MVITTFLIFIFIEIGLNDDISQNKEDKDYHEFKKRKLNAG